MNDIDYLPVLIVIDNYDSFTYNLVQMFMRYPLDIRVYRSDKIPLEAVVALCPDYVLISPGPRDPAYTGVSMPLIRALFRHVPILGVCLGMQCINEVFGGKTIRSDVPMHGKTSLISHENGGIFENIPSPFVGARYHSLQIVPNCSSDLAITARTQDGTIMGIAHIEFPLHGVQFHPESFLTEYGHRMIENFLSLGPLNLTHGADFRRIDTKCPEEARVSSLCS